MEALIKRKIAIKGQMTRLTNYITAKDETASYDELSIRLTKTHQIYKQFVAVEDQMFQLDSTVESKMDTIDDQYFSIISKTQALIRGKSLSAATPTNHDYTDTFMDAIKESFSPDFELPYLQFPIFNGNIITNSSSYARVFHSADQQPACLLCPQEAHKLSLCLKFRAMPINQRRDFITKTNRCSNCFSDKHTVTRCRIRRHCQKCQRQHNTLLHYVFNTHITNERTQPSVSGAPPNKDDHANFVVSSTKPTTTNSAPDAVVPISAYHNSVKSKVYILPITKKVNITYNNINQTQAGVSRSKPLVILRSPIDHDYQMNLEVFILPTLSPKYPAEAFNKSLSVLEENSLLADSEFNVSATEKIKSNFKSPKSIPTGNIVSVSQVEVTEILQSKEMSTECIWKVKEIGSAKALTTEEQQYTPRVEESYSEALRSYSPNDKLLVGPTIQDVNTIFLLTSRSCLGRL